MDCIEPKTENIFWLKWFIIKQLIYKENDRNGKQNGIK